MAYSLIPGTDKSALTPSLKRLLLLGLAVWLLLLAAVGVVSWMGAGSAAELKTSRQKRDTLSIQIAQMKQALDTKVAGEENGATGMASVSLQREELQAIFDLIPDNVTLQRFTMGVDSIRLTGVSRERILRTGPMLNALRAQYALQTFQVVQLAPERYRFTLQLKRGDAL